MRVIRQIVYDSQDQKALDLQLQTSMPDCEKHFTRNHADVLMPSIVYMKVQTICDERVMNRQCPLCTDPVGDLSAGKWCQRHQRMGVALIELIKVTVKVTK